MEEKIKALEKQVRELCVQQDIERSRRQFWQTVGMISLSLNGSFIGSLICRLLFGN